jgi:hypothetical protein
MWIVWFSLAAAVISLGGFLAPVLRHEPPHGAWPAAIITGVAGLQIGNARRTFSYTAPGEIRPWMRPAALTLYAISLGIFLFAIWITIV